MMEYDKRRSICIYAHTCKGIKQIAKGKEDVEQGLGVGCNFTYSVEVGPH